MLLPGAQGDGAAFGAHGLRRIDHQIHDHLIDLRRQAFDVRQGLVLLDQVGLVLEFTGDNVQGRLDALLQIGPLPLLLAIDPGEILQVLDDLPDPANAFLGFADQHRNVFEEKIQIGVFAQLLKPRHGFAVWYWPKRLPGIEYAEQLFEVAVEGAEVGGDEADRVVDFMGHARRHLPQ
ncbi:hypothetical protein D3C81_1355660 [compost metagenome]